MVNKVKIIQKLAIIHENKVLTLQRSLTDKARPGTWDLVGGNVDDEDVYKTDKDLLIESLKREVVEETGFELGETKVEIVYISSYYHPDGYIGIWIGYVCNINKRPHIKLSYEHSDYKWMTKEEFLKLGFGYAQEPLIDHVSNINF